MKVVYFGDSNSFYNINVLEHMKEQGVDCEIIDIFTETKNYRRKFDKIKYLRTVETIIILKKILKSYHFNPREDIAQINYVAFIYFFLTPFFKKSFKKYILYFWGSDIYRQPKELIRIMRPLYKGASYICFETPKVATDFHKIIPQYQAKDYYLRFGLPILDLIDKIKPVDITLFKNKFKIPMDKRIIVIGYNRRKEQQHISVVSNLTQNMIDESFFIFPWSYGFVSEEYEKELISLINNRKMNYLFLRDRLSDSDIACFRCITDVLIQVQTTDSFSGSMLETLYAKKTVIAGKWLPYDILYENNVKMILVDSPDEVGSVLNHVNSLSLSELEKEKNKKEVSNLCKWTSCIRTWINLYK